jgi:hypothetical protein
MIALIAWRQGSYSPELAEMGMGRQGSTVVQTAAQRHSHAGRFRLSNIASAAQDPR